MFSGVSFYGVKIYLNFCPQVLGIFFPNEEVRSWQKLGAFLINKGVKINVIKSFGTNKSASPYLIFKNKIR